MYNSYYALPTIPYNILKHLALSDEIIWKLLKYNDYDALDRPNLTFSEKWNWYGRVGLKNNTVYFLLI